MVHKLIIGSSTTHQIPSNTTLINLYMYSAQLFIQEKSLAISGNLCKSLIMNKFEVKSNQKLLPSGTGPNAPCSS